MIISDIFVTTAYCKNVYCDPSSEPSQRDGSDEWLQHMVSMRNKTNYLSSTIK